MGIMLPKRTPASREPFSVLQAELSALDSKWANSQIVSQDNIVVPILENLTKPNRIGPFIDRCICSWKEIFAWISPCTVVHYHFRLHTNYPHLAPSYILLLFEKWLGRCFVMNKIPGLVFAEETISDGYLIFLFRWCIVCSSCSHLTQYWLVSKLISIQRYAFITNYA